MNYTIKIETQSIEHLELQKLNSQIRNQQKKLNRLWTLVSESTGNFIEIAVREEHFYDKLISKEISLIRDIQKRNCA